MEKDPRDIFGEYDPPYNFNKKPTKEQIEAARKLEEKYIKLAAERKKRNHSPAEQENLNSHPWSQCEGIGKYDFFVKRWLDE